MIKEILQDCFLVVLVKIYFVKGELLFMKRHILVVDDVAVNLKTVKLILDEFYRVSVVTSGKQAIDFLSRNIEDFPDLILMDIQMPIMDGLETMKKIKEKFGDNIIPVIYLTAISDKKMVVECFKEGLSDYIVKPFQPENLLQKIKNVLED